MPVLPVLPPMGAALRFLCHAPADDRERRDFDTMLRGLRQTAIDLRIMTLPPGPDAASRAIGGFLIELVARADWSRSIPFAVPLPTTPFSQRANHEPHRPHRARSPLYGDRDVDPYPDRRDHGDPPVAGRYLSAGQSAGGQRRFQL
jgi:hypothetical protein